MCQQQEQATASSSYINRLYLQVETTTLTILQTHQRHPIPLQMSSLKNLRPTQRSDLLSHLPDDILLLILSKLSSSASSPSDFLTVLLTCRRMNRLAMTPSVLRELSPDAMVVPARNWSDCSHRFLRRCVHSGNVEAHYLLGMIRFYCLGIRASGASLMAKAAMRNHAPSLYSLAVIHFNASGKSKEKKDLEAGFVLCARAAYLGSINALRELGHVLLDGYGVRRDCLHGRRLILQASLLELQALKKSNDVVAALHKPDAAHRFLRDWFDARNDDVGLMRLCSSEVCGRVETRVNEFRRCAMCGDVKYCSRGCQALHWRSGHKDVCVPNGADDAEEVEGAPDGAVNVNVDFDDGINFGLV